MALDNFRTIELIWDKANKSIIKTIKTASSDTTGRYLSVKILDGGQEVTLNNAKLQLYWEHPNFNTSGTDDFTTANNGGLFNMTFSDEMLTNIGELNAHLVLTLSDGKITSDGFPIEVFKGADSGVVVPTNGGGLVKQIDGKIDKGNVTLNDLTQEVKLAMTGGSVAVVGENAVGTENVKDDAVTRGKMAKNFADNGRIFNTDNLDTIIREGRYFKTPGANPVGLPSALIAEDIILEVGNIRLSSSIDLVTQTIIVKNKPDIRYYRAYQTDVAVKPTFRSNKELERLNLTNLKLSHQVKEGRYLGLSSTNYTDLPSGMVGKSFLMEVTTFGAVEGFVIQHIFQTSGQIQNSYKRYVQVAADGIMDNNTVYDWAKDNSLMSTNLPLSGKKVVIIGDSQMEGSSVHVDVAKRTGAEVIQIGFGGCRMAKVPAGHFREVYNEMSGIAIAQTIVSQNFTALDAAALNLATNHGDDNRPQVATLKSIDWATVDHVIFTYMTNDYTSRVAIGTETSVNHEEFGGAVNEIIRIISQAHKHIKIGFASATWRSRMDVGDGKESDSSANADGAYLYDYVELAREITRKNKVPYLDLYYTSGINKYNFDYWLSDGLHWSSDGQRLIGEQIGAWLVSA